MRRITLRSLLAVLVLALAATGLVACGGGATNESADQLLSDTFGSSHDIKSGKLDVSLKVQPQGSTSQGPFSLDLSGPFQSQGKGKLPEFAFKLALGTSGQSFTAGATSTGDQGYVSFMGTDYAVPSNVFDSFKKGFLQAQSSGKSGSSLSFSSLGIDPRTWLKSPRKVGTADVAGTKTVHITAGVDVPKLLTDLNTILGKAGQLGVTSPGTVPSRLTPQQQQEVAQSVKSAKVDIYTGASDKILRRLDLTVDVNVPKSLQKQSQGFQAGRIGFDVTLADLNQGQSITAPANPKPLSDLLQQIQGLTGGLGAATGSGSSSGGSAGAAGGSSAANLQKYSQCLQNAGNDVAKAQKCASLLK